MLLFFQRTFTVCIAILSFYLQAQENYTNYTVRDGLPSNTVYCVVQDDQGFMWFGTDAGLSRYDGFEFKNYGLKDGLPDVEILNFYKDSMGRIWIYTLNGKVSFVKDGKIHNSSNTKFLEGVDFDSRITSIQEQNGIVLISALSYGVKIFSEERIIHSLSSTRQSNYLQLVDDKWFWILTNRYGFIIYSGLIENVEGLYSKIIEEPMSDRIPFKSGIRYMVTKDYLIIGSTFTNVDQCVFSFNTLDNNLSFSKVEEYEILNIKILNEDILLFTSDGIKKLDEISLRTQSLTPVQDPTSLIEDHEGNRWITTLNSGVLLEKDGQVRKELANKISSAQRLKVFEDSTLYMLFNKDVIGNINPNKKLQKSFQTTYKSELNGFYIDEIKNVWTLNIIALFKNEELVSSLRHGASRSLLRGGVLVQKEGINTNVINIQDWTIQRFENVSGDKIKDFIFLSADRILVIGRETSYVLDLNSLMWKPVQQLQDIEIRKMEVDDFGKLWLSTNGYGLIRLDRDAILDLSVEEILNKRVSKSSDVVNNLLLVDTTLYASTPMGIEKIVFSENEALKVGQITEANGLETARINDLEFFNGDVYIAQDNGLFSFSHSQSFEEPSDFPVLIDDIITSDSTYAVGDSPYELDYNVGLIQFNCKAINFKYRSSLTYQFRLASGFDFDNGWTESGSNQVVFSNLRPGSYTFQFRAKTANSDWTKPVSTNFKIKAAYWQTWWFRTMAALITILLTYFVIYKIQLSVRNRKRLSREKVLSDLKALKAQINPHFLFNSLNSIQSFVLDDKENLAKDYLVKYGKLMRRILNHSNELTIYLYDEIEAIQLYIDLEKIRLDKQLEVNIKISDRINTYETKVPSMIIQPLLENAIWHGIQPSKRDGKITLSFDEIGEKIHVTIEDNGVGFNLSDSSKSEPHGITLVKERVELLNDLKGVSSTFDILSNDQGTKITFSYSVDLN